MSERDELTEVSPELRAPLNEETPRHALRQLITPVESRFARSHFPVPEVVPEQLDIGGAVGEPMRISLGQLRQLPSVTLTVTTECAGNHRAVIEPKVAGEPWTGGAISTSQWTGVPLERLLAWTGVKEAAVDVSFHAADAGYARSLPLAKAMERDTLVAWEMNGAPIPRRYGGPIRLVVPAWYGMASVKWLIRIEVLERPFEGEFQTDKYQYAPGVPVTVMRVKSTFLDPQDGATLRKGKNRIRGLAWGGEGGVVQVEVAIGGQWQNARILGPLLPHAWRRFELDWDAKAAGSFTLRCRARDAAGNLQPEQAEWNPAGYGANPVERIQVRVSG